MWIAIAILIALLALAELYVWYSEVLWHKEDQRARGDWRNWGPKR